MTPARPPAQDSEKPKRRSILEIVRDIAFIGAVFSYFAGFRYLDGVNDQFNVPGDSLSEIPLYQLISYGGTVFLSNLDAFVVYGVVAVEIVILGFVMQRRGYPESASVLTNIFWFVFAGALFWRLYGLSDTTATLWVQNVVDCADAPRVRLALTKPARDALSRSEPFFVRLNDSRNLRLVALRPDGVVLARRWSVWYHHATRTQPFSEQRIIVTYRVPKSEYVAITASGPGFNCESSSVGFSDLPTAVAAKAKPKPPRHSAKKQRR